MLSREKVEAHVKQYFPRMSMIPPVLESTQKEIEDYARQVAANPIEVFQEALAERQQFKAVLQEHFDAMAAREAEFRARYQATLKQEQTTCQSKQK